MKSILKDTNNSEKLLNMVSDTLILMDKDGVCVDMAVHNVDLWFMNEERLRKESAEPATSGDIQ